MIIEPFPTPRAKRTVLIIITVVRIIQVASWPLAIRTGGDDGLAWPVLAWVGWGCAATATVVMLVGSWVRRRLPVALGWVDFGAAGVGLVLGGLATAPGYGTGFHHPSLAIAIGTAATMAVAWPWRRLTAAVATLTAAYLAGVYATLALGAVVLTSALANVATLVGVPLAVGLVLRSWRAGPPTSGPEARAAERLQVAEQELSAVRTREAERTRQYRILHDTVLSTLSAVSRGSLDPREPVVRQRLAADADYLRGLIATTGSTAGMRLVGELAGLGREQAQLGLRVHPHLADVPDELPDDVLSALTGAVRESLNNVAKHSETSEAWVTIVGAADRAPGLTVTVTDRGVGFDPQRAPAGIGLGQSIAARLAEVGGRSMVDSAPGQGTSVELQWPA